MTDTDLQFQTGGTLVPNKHFYVERREQDELFTKCVAGEYCYILAARQLGKSSMAKQVIEKLRNETTVLSISTDLSAISKNPSEGMETFADFWYKNFLWHILDRSQLRFGRDEMPTRSHFLSWWKEKTEFDNLQRMILFFKEVILGHRASQVVVFIDEIDRFPRDLMDDFLMALRYLHNERAEIPELQRLSFVLIGQRLPRNLTVDKSISPFNIGSRIDLDDLEIQKAEILTSGVVLSGTLTHQQLLERIFIWTNGHPYLTHATCKKIFELTTDESAPFYLSTLEQIDTIINDLAKSEFADIHLNKIVDWINSLPNQIDVIRLYGFILEGNPVLFDEAIQSLDDLRYSGLIKIRNGLAEIRNRIYAQVFNKDWVTYQLNQNGAVVPTNFSFGLDRLGIREARRDLDTSVRVEPEKNHQTVEFRVEESVDSLPETAQAAEELTPSHADFKKEKLLVEEEHEGLFDEADKSESLIPKLKDFLGLIQNKRIALTIAAIVITTAIISWGLYVHSVFSLVMSGGFLLILLLIIGIVVSITSEKFYVEERLARYLEQEREENAAESLLLTEWLNRKAAGNAFGHRVARELARADIQLRVAEYVVIVIIFTLGSSLILGALGNWSIFSIFIGAIMGLLGPQIYIRSRQRKRLVLFDSQLSGTLNLMSNGLRSGYSTMQVIEAVSRDMPAPISDEFRRVALQMQIGIPMETALENLLRRIPSENLDFVVTAINLQREVGGNLSEIFDTISYRLRTQNLDKLHAERLGFPPFSFFYVFSSVFLILHSIIFPDGFDLLRLHSNIQGGVWILILVWSFVLIIMSVIRIVRHNLSVELTGEEPRKDKFFWGMVSFATAYLFGVPEMFVAWLFLMLLLWTPFGVLLGIFTWLFAVMFFLATNFPNLSAISPILARFQTMNMVSERLFLLFLGDQETNISSAPQLSPILPWIIGLSILIVSILVILASLRRSTTHEDDPLQPLLAEYIQRGDIASLEEIELSVPFTDRFVFPVLRRLGDFAARFTPHKQIIETAKNLELAGNPWPIDAPTFIAIRMLLALLLGSLLTILDLNSPTPTTVSSFLMIFIAIIAGFYLPQIDLNNRIKQRQKNILNAMPYALELMVIGIEAGLGLDAAMSKVAEKWENELSLVFLRTNREVQLGKVRREALRDMSARIGLPEMNGLVAAIIQSEQLGVSISRILRTHSDTLFANRRESILNQLSRLDTVCKLLLFILFGPILMFWFTWPILAQLSVLP